MTRSTAFLTALVLTLGLGATAEAARTEQGMLILDGIPVRDAALSERLQRYLEGRQATFMDWLPDGTMLIATRFGDSAQIHRVRAPLMQREQLTFNKDPVSSAAAAPYAADTFVFTRDKGGNENAQIYLQNITTGATKLLTDGKSLHGRPLWAHDGKRIAFQSNARDGQSFDIYVLDTTIAAPPRLVLSGQGEAWEVLDWSLDDTRLLVRRDISIAESYLHLLDVASGKTTPVEPAGEAPPEGGKRRNAAKGAAPAKVAVGDAKFAADGRGILVISDHGGEFTQLRYVDMFSGAQQLVSPELRWDVEQFDVSRDGRYVAYVVNEAGFSRLTITDNQTKSEFTPPGLPAGLISSLRFDRTSKRIALSVESAQTARDVYVYELAGGAVARWTQSEMGPIDPARNVPAELVRFPTWDRVGGDFRQVPAFIYRPRTPGPHPVLLYIHGGPESQYRPSYDAFMQFVVNELGYAVVAPNVRGSSGYGRSFLALDNGRLREDSVRDIGSLLAWIGAQTTGVSTLDRSRVVVMGGSYGGYMTLASMVQYGDRLAGGVDTVGISNFVTFLEKTSAYRRDLRRVEYGDERDPGMRSFLQRISPLTNAQSIKKPLLIVQGMNDPRVPASESEQMLLRVRAGGGDVWYLAAKDEGHGFRKKSNRDFYLETVAAFLARFAPPITPAP